MRGLRTAPLPTALQVLQGLELRGVRGEARGVRGEARGVRGEARSRVSGNPEGNQRVPSTLSFRKFPGKPEGVWSSILATLEFP